MYAAFAGLEKASDRGLCKILWWGLRKLGVDEWVICLVKAMYNNSLSSVQVNGCYSEPFKLMVSVHKVWSLQGPLLLIMEPYQERLESVVHLK